MRVIRECKKYFTTNHNLTQNINVALFSSDDFIICDFDIYFTNALITSSYILYLLTSCKGFGEGDQ